MESDLESAAEKVGPRWAVGPTEDVVQALMETLVDPLLPLRVSNVIPSEDVQIAVAKQMHAVVLLYNYHHRKQKPELEFLEFVNFCKLAIVIRPPLIAFMKMMKDTKPTELDGTEDYLSVTEKAIKDACDIALGLVASRDVPNMEGWSISKVAVLLIDSKKEKFMVQFGSVTIGAWSLIEKELNESTITPKIAEENKVGNKRKRDNLNVSTYNTELLQLGYDAVKDVTGISSLDLAVLEIHMTYSLSKEKSAACFYIMQCPESFIEHEQVPLKFLVESVQGPLAEKFTDGSWKTTPLVKFHHMLPYVELILSWLSGIESLNLLKYDGNLDHIVNDRCGTKVNSSDEKASENCYTNNKCDDSSHGQVTNHVDTFQSTEKDGKLTNQFVKRFNVLDSAESSQNGILENSADDSKQPDKGLSCSPSKGLCEMVEVDNTTEQFENGCELVDPATEVENSDTESDVPVSGHFRRLFGNKVVCDNVREKFNEKLDVGHSAEKDERRICPETLDEDRVGCGKDVLSGPRRVLKTTNMNHLTNICTESEHGKKLNSKIKVYHHRRKKDSSLKNAAQLGEVVPDFKVDIVDSLKSNHTQRRDEKVSGDGGYITCNQAGTGSTGDQQLESKIKHNIEVQSTSDSLMPYYIQSRDETVSVDKGYHTHGCIRTGIAATGNQLAEVEAKLNNDLGAQTLSASDQKAQLEDKIKHNIDVQRTPDLFMPDHIQSRDEMVSGDEGDHTYNQAGTGSTGDQQHESKIKHNIEVQSTSDSLVPDYIQCRDEKVSVDEGYHTHGCIRTGIAAMENQLAQVEAKLNHDLGAQTLSASDQQAQLEDKIKHNIDVQRMPDLFMPDHIQSRDEMVSRDEGHHTYRCNQTAIAATGNQLAQAEAKFNHDLGEQTLSAPDQLQNALALLYRKRRELYSQICKMEDTLALCEDNVARIRDGGEVDLARRCIKSVISGKFHLPLENETQVQDNGNQLDENNINSQHANPGRIYLPGKSSCQDLEYTCLRNNWRLPRYLTESSDGKFQSNVVMEGKDFKLHAKGSFESDPCAARETAAAEIITLMQTAFCNPAWHE